MSIRVSAIQGVAEIPAVAPVEMNGDPGMVSAPMRILERLVEDIAPTDLPILLVGESGTGKEWMAARIHRMSERAQEPLLKVSCATLTLETLSTIRKSLQNGRGEEAGRRGTLLLDEIGELDPSLQAKLLHVLPDGDANGGQCFCGRVLATTKHNLEEDLRAGRFREELYYRINGVQLRMPPLRQRREDIPGLVTHFLEKHAAAFRRSVPSPSPQTMQILANHSWPGNIRELETAVKKIVLLGEERAALVDLEFAVMEPKAAPFAGEPIPLRQAARAASRKAERELISKVLERTHWNRKRAAQELQISYKAMLYKLKQLGLTEDTGS